MRYMRIEENAMDHPKFIALNAGAWRLWCEGGTYCQKHLTDGLIPMSALKGFRYYSAGAMKQLLEALVPSKGPLWHRVDGGIQVHDYLDHNESRERVLKMRQDGKDRLERWKAEKAAKVDKNALQNVASHNVSNDVLHETRNATNRTGTYQACKDHKPTGAQALDPARRSHPLDEHPRSVLSPEAVEAGSRFLAAYPVKQGQAAAKRAWIALNPDDDTIAAIFANLEARAKQGWGQHARFLPYPGRFLEDEMWKEDYVPRDEAPPAARVVPGAERTEDYLAKHRAARG